MTATDFTYAGMPAVVPAGHGAIKLTNTAPGEDHEMAMARLTAAGEAADPEEFLPLPDKKVEKYIDFSTTGFVFAEAGETAYGVLGSSRHLHLCVFRERGRQGARHAPLGARHARDVRSAIGRRGAAPLPVGSPARGSVAAVRKLKLPKAHVVVLIVGVLVAVATLASGIAPRVTEWHEGSLITPRAVRQRARRHVLGVLHRGRHDVVRLCLAGEPARAQLRARQARRPPHDPHERPPPDARLPGRACGCRRCCATPPPGSCTPLIYFGFLWLFIATVVLEIDHQLPDNLKFLHGGVYEGYSFAADLGGVVFITGIVWAIGRRYVQRPYRIRIKTKPEDAVILGTFLVIGVTGFLTEALAHRAGGPARLREVVVRRLPAVAARRRVVGHRPVAVRTA